jgi:hypothetical protein
MNRLAADSRAFFIRPIAEAEGPLTKVVELIEEFGAEDLLRCIDRGVPVYDAGTTLMADYALISLTAGELGTARAGEAA